MSAYNDDDDHQRLMNECRHLSRQLDAALQKIEQIEQKGPDVIGDVAKICRGYGHRYKPGAHEDQAIVDLRKNLIEEESAETALGLGYYAPKWDLLRPGEPPVVDPVKTADGLVDTMVVCAGALNILFGEPCARELWTEVQRSNEAKIGPNGEVIRRVDGKCLKPEGWTPPDVEGVLRKHGILPACAQDAPCFAIGCTSCSTFPSGSGG